MVIVMLFLLRKFLTFLRPLRPRPEQRVLTRWISV